MSALFVGRGIVRLTLDTFRSFSLFSDEIRLSAIYVVAIKRIY